MLCLKVGENMNWNDVKWKLKNKFASNYLGQKFWILFSGKSKGVVVDASVDIVIEGYPRSGNTFCVALFRYLSTSDIKIARHRHEIAQIKSSIRFKKIAIFVIREPLSSVSSFVVREDVSVKYALEYYIKYYSELMASLDYIYIVRNTEDFVENARSFLGLSYLSSYDSDDFGEVNKFVLDMEREDSGGIVRASHVAMPNKDRDESKNAVIFEMHSKYEKEVKDALDCYNSLLEMAKVFGRMV